MTLNDYIAEVREFMSKMNSDNENNKQNDLSINFTLGIRFYFQYEKLIKYPNVIFDGILPMKVKDEIHLCDWVYAIIVSSEAKSKIENSIPYTLNDKIIYVENDYKDIWEWSEKV
jgi:hypothetical protein